jgi:hypothetical protein
MQDNPFADLIPATGAPQRAPAQPIQPQQPRRPLPSPPPPPERIAAEQRAQADQGMQQQRFQQQTVNEQARLGQEQERLRLAQEREARDAARAAREATPAGATEGERNSAGFLRRAINAETNYGGIDFNPDTPTRDPVQPRGLIGQFMAENAPGLLNTLPGGIGNSNERQLADQAQREFIAAILRADSGAAIPDQEYVAMARTYFPQPGDSPAVLAQKEQARRVAIEGLRAEAGRAAQGVPGLPGQPTDQQGAMPGAVNNGATPSGNVFNTPAPDPGSGRENVVGFGEDDAGTGYRLPSEAETAFQQFAQSRGPNFTVADAEQWMRQNIPGQELTFTPEWRERMGAYVEAIRTGSEVGGGIDYSLTDEARTALLEQRAQASGQREAGAGGWGQSADAFIRGAVDIPTLGMSDEISAAGQTLFGGGTMQDNLEYERYINQRDTENNGIARFSGQLAGSLAIPTRAPGVALAAGTRALRGGEGMAAARNAAANAFTRRTAGEGAAFGGAYGFGSSEGDLGDRAGGAATGAALGGTAGAAIGRGAPYVQNALTQFAARGNAQQAGRAALLGDFEAQGVTALPANVGGAGVGRATGAAAQFPAGAGTVVGAAANQADEFGAAVGRAASQAGNRTNSEVAGNTVRQAGDRMIQRTSATGGRLYERAERMAGNTRIQPSTALNTIDSEIARLSETAEINAPLISELQRFRQSLSNGNGISVSGMRDARTIARRASNTEALRSTDAQRSLGLVMRSIADDIDTGLQAAGRGNAAQAFRNADRMWAERIQTIDQVLEPLIGRNRSGENIMSAIQGMATDTGRGNAARLRQVMQQLDPQERGEVLATVIERMGRARAGQQDDTAARFSAETFLTNWSSLSSQGRNALFSGELRQNLDQIARVASAMRTTGRFANSSQTGGVVGWLMTGSGVVANPVGGAGFAAAQYGLGRLMTSPGFTRWLARAPRNTAPPPQYIQRLTQVAQREPVIAGDIQALQQQLAAAFSQSPMRAAAEGQQEQNGGQIPPQ